MDEECVEYDLLGKCVKWKKRKVDGEIIMELTQSKSCPIEMLDDATKKIIDGHVTVRIKK